MSSLWYGVCVISHREEYRTMINQKGLHVLQQKLALAERTGDSMEIARGYLVLADKLLEIGNRQLSTLFITRAGEYLTEMDTSPSFLPDRSSELMDLCFSHLPA